MPVPFNRVFVSAARHKKPLSLDDNRLTDVPADLRLCLIDLYKRCAGRRRLVIKPVGVFLLAETQPPDSVHSHRRQGELWRNPSMRSDTDLLQAFEDCSLPEDEFHHATHIRVA